MKNTPGVAGYLLAWLASVLAFGLLVPTIALLMGEAVSPADAVTGFVIVTFYAAWMSVPFALVGMPLVHLACRRIRAQGVHVLAAAVAGSAPSVLFSAMAGEPVLWPFAVVAPAAAIGRRSVVPLVDRRRRLARAVTVVR